MPALVKRILIVFALDRGFFGFGSQRLESCLLSSIMEVKFKSKLLPFGSCFFFLGDLGGSGLLLGFFFFCLRLLKIDFWSIRAVLRGFTLFFFSVSCCFVISCSFLQIGFLKLRYFDFPPFL